MSGPWFMKVHYLQRASASTPHTPAAWTSCNESGFITVAANATCDLVFSTAEAEKQVNTHINAS
eukprot:1183186-Prorocentrum_minimum.AAC.6